MARVEIAAMFGVSIEDSKSLSVRRATALVGGIDMLKMSLRRQTADPEFRQSRNLKYEKAIANDVSAKCNCHGKDKFSSPTFFTLVATEFENPIIAKDGKGSCGEEELMVMSKSVFFGMVQGDEKKPWIKTSDENKWYLHFGTEIHHYYAPVTGIIKLSVEAYKF